MLKKIAIVLGPHRSGTSLVAKSMEVAGYSLGENLMPVGEDNPKGFWEDVDIVSFNDRLLEVCYSNWDRPILIFEGEQSELLAQYIPEAKALLSAKLEGIDRLAIKDPRMCLLLPFWRHVFESMEVDARYIYVYRNPLDVAASLNKRNKLELDLALPLWMLYSYSALRTLENNCLILGYQSMLQAPIESLQCVAKYLDVKELDEEKVEVFSEEFLDKGLCHHQHSIKDLSDNPSVSKLLERLAELLQAWELSAPENILEDLSGLGIDEQWPQFELSYLHAQMKKDFADLGAIKEDFGEQLKSLMAEISYRDGELENKDALIVGQQYELEEKSVWAQSLQNDVEERDALINAQTTEIAEQQQALVESFSQIEFLEDDLAVRDQQIREYDQLYREVLGSVSFKLGRLLTYPLRKPIAKFIVPRLQHRPRVLAVVSFAHSVLASPIKFARLLSFGRIRNFFILLFRRQNMLEQVVGRYNDALEDKPSDNAAAELNAVKGNIDYENFSLSFVQHKQPKVSVIIPVYNQVEYTVNCLKSIRQSLPKVSFEILIADDCSTDNTEEVMSRVKGIKYIKNPENLGFLLSCNRAVDFANGEYVFLLNNDTRVKTGWLDELVKIFDQREDAGLVGSKLIYPDGCLQEAGGIIWDDATGWNYGRLDNPAKPEYNYLKEVDYVSGAAILFPKKMFLAIGKFDERYIPAYYEDTDLAFAVRALGKKVYMQPKSVVVHYEGVSNGQDLSTGVKQHQVINNKKFYEKWRQVLGEEHSANAENLFQSRDRSKDKLTILVVDHYVPHFDKDAGSKSTFQYLKLMVESGYNVKFIGDNFYRHEPYSTVLETLGVELLLGSYYQHHWKTWLKENAAYIDVAYLHRPHIAEKYVDYIKSLGAGIKIIYFGHDLHYLRLQRQYEVEGSSALLKEVESWKARERALFKKVDIVMYPSAVEISEIKAEDESINGKAIPLYVLDVEERISTDGRTDLLFVGGFNHSPNADAMLWFCSEVMPLIVAKIPEIKLHIVGSNVPDEIESLATNSVIVHGFLSEDELTELYNNVVLSVVPLRYGAGIKGKVLESMACGVPVVTTSIGAEGIPDKDSCMDIADEAKEFAENTVQVYESEELRLDMITASYKMLKEHFSSQAVKKVLVENFENESAVKE